MFTVSTFYLSRILKNKIYTEDQKVLGRLMDLAVDATALRPKVIAAVVKSGSRVRTIDTKYIDIAKLNNQYILSCREAVDIEVSHENTFFLNKNVIDRQIVDFDGHKIVRVNDIRMAIVSTGTYAVAVDVGLEGLMRRLGVAKPLKALLKPLKLTMPSELILWDDVATVDFSQAGIKLSKKISKLSTLHPSDLADIIEDLDKNMQIAVFEQLDQEKAADVLEELESDVQVSLLENMAVEKAADMLEIMPADEVADILDELADEKAEELLGEMEQEASEEVRELMEYPENSVGSLMATDFISFNENITVGATLDELRHLQPEADTIYYLYVLDDDNKLIATVSLRDIVVTSLEKPLTEIMNTNVIFVYDDDKIDIIADIISKYNLLAIPVVDRSMVMVGIVLIDDVVHSMIKAKKRRM